MQISRHAGKMGGVELLLLAKLLPWIGSCLVIAAGVFVCLTASAAEALDSPSTKVELRIIYFGYPASPRAKDFVGFLEKHFSKVGQGDLDTFRESDTAGYDVTILDYGELRVINKRIESPKRIISRQYSRPTVTIGATGALVSGRLGLKTGYL